MEKILILGLALVASAAQAVLSTNIYSAPFANGAVIPDNNYSGWTDTQTWTGPAGTITPGSVQVLLDLSGGWNGDLYAYLVHGTGFAVLLDRVGQGTGSEPTLTYGFGTAGMNVWLSDSTGSSIDTTAAPGFGGTTYSRGGVGYAGDLSTFNNLNTSGTWTLFIADLSGGGVTTVQNWGLQMDIVAVPEVETWIAAALAGAFGAFWLNRQIWSGVKQPER